MIKEVIINGDVYIRKKDINIFLNNVDNLKILDKQFNLIKEFFLECSKLEDVKNYDGSNTFKLPLNIFRKQLLKTGIRETVFLKNAYNKGFIIKNTQGKFKHSTTIDAVKTIVLIVNALKLT